MLGDVVKENFVRFLVTGQQALGILPGGGGGAGFASGYAGMGDN